MSHHEGARTCQHCGKPMVVRYGIMLCLDCDLNRPST